ncbi:MAG: hypothetical protein LBE12_12120 [Planctomycetaceae bacterium]|nr:hypothetical protein [Planctomycetaceae bacterium]
MRHYQLSTINYPLSTIHYQLSTINSQLLSRSCRALENEGVPAPAVKRSATAGYAFHPPSGVKSTK